jgi:Secretory lipase
MCAELLTHAEGRARRRRRSPEIADAAATGRRRRGVRRGTSLSVGLLLLVCLALAVPAAQAAPPTPAQDPFYSYQGATPLSSIPTGTVLKTRTLSYHLVGIPLPIKTVQLLYRTTNSLGQADVNVTSVLEPLLSFGPPKVVGYQSFYDSLNPNDEPSYSISGGLTLGGIIPSVEAILIVPQLLAGNAVVVADTEGETADFAAGPEYGMTTLDSLKAALASPATGLRGSTKVGLIGYSGGAIATEWAAELAPTYAPSVNRFIVGAAFGGVLVDPAHNLHYVDGSSVWAGVMPMALIGIARAYHIDLTPYLSAYGTQLDSKLQNASIINVLLQYPGLTFAQLTQPQYATPESIPVYVQVVNKLIMGTGGTPTAPLFIGQGAYGELEGTSGNKPGIGEGDGVMIAGDVRSLANEYCQRGVTVQYNQYNLGHVGSALPWLAQAMPWLSDRLNGKAAPSDCGSIAPGNSLAPITP